MLFALLYYAKIPIKQIIVQTLFQLDPIFALSAIFFYFTLSTLAIELLRQMRIEIENFNNGTRFLKPTIYAGRMEFYLKKWRHRYLTLSELVGCINQCFGAILFQSTLFFFCTIVNDFFFSIILFKISPIPYFPVYLYKFLKSCVYIVSIASVASQMKTEVSL